MFAIFNIESSLICLWLSDCYVYLLILTLRLGQGHTTAASVECHVSTIGLLSKITGFMQIFPTIYDHNIPALSINVFISSWCYLKWTLSNSVEPDLTLQKTVLETAGRIVTKCDQTLVWATKFFPKDRPENEFGRPNLGRGYRMFSAYLRSISEINIFKTDQRTWGNNIVFLSKEAAIILNGSLRFSATCCLILFSKKTFSRTRLTL